MTPGESAQVITAVAALGAMLTSAIGLLVSLLNRGKIDIVKAHVEKVEKATNGMKTELVEEVRRASFAKGVKSETDKEQHGR